MCEILAGCLAGSPTAGPIPGGSSAAASSTACSRSTSTPPISAPPSFAQTARDFATYVRATAPVTPGGEVLVPGDAEDRTRTLRLRDGIPLQDFTWAAIQATGDGLNVPRPSPR